MSFTAANIQAMETALKQAAGALLAPQQVDLYQGPSVTVKLHVSSRRATEAELTAGATVDTQLIATIDADDWDVQAGRMPQRGDVIHWAGMRHAVDRASLAAPAGNKAFYKARLQG